jgi:hypothetical protein
MAAKNSPIIVEFINHHVFEIFEKFYPFSMMGQNSRMEHIWIGDDNVALTANCFSGILGSVSIIGKNFDFFFQKIDDFIQFGPLILRKSLGREKINSPGRRIAENVV